jgi:23S rRNA-/tRNA-specific pseudouridylate synthase
MTTARGEQRPLLDWMLDRFPDTPRKRVKQWIVAGRVVVRGKVARSPHQPMLDPRDGIELMGREAVTVACDPEWPIHPQLGLLYLDSSLAAVNKAAG